MFGSRSIIGGLLGAYIGVLVAKRLIGYRAKTGDLFAPAVALVWPWAGSGVISPRLRGGRPRCHLDHTHGAHLSSVPTPNLGNTSDGRGGPATTNVKSGDRHPTIASLSSSRHRKGRNHAQTR